MDELSREKGYGRGYGENMASVKGMRRRGMEADGKEAKPTSEAPSRYLRDEALGAAGCAGNERVSLSGRSWMEVVVGTSPGLPLDRSSESGKALELARQPTIMVVVSIASG